MTCSVLRRGVARILRGPCAPRAPRLRELSCPRAGLHQAWFSSVSRHVSAELGKSTVTQKLWRERREVGGRELAGSHAVLYAFSSEPALRGEYVGNTGKVLVGRLLEDLDALAGNVAFDWCQGIRSSDGEALVLVTAVVDRISFARPIPITDDVVLSGRVIWTGSSSMLVRMQMHAGRVEGQGEELLVADFVYVARDHSSGRSVKVPEVSSQTPDEIKLFQEGERKAAAQRAARSKAVEPDLRVAQTIQTMLEEGEACEDLPAWHATNTQKVLMQSTALEATSLTKPQHTNTAGKVFGGYLMRAAYELAFTTCYAFAGRHPTFVEVSEFVFRRPVPLGSILRLKSRVVLTRDSLCLVCVLVKVVSPEQGTSLRADEIVVIFETGGPLPQILPLRASQARKMLAAAKVLDAVRKD